MEEDKVMTRPSLEEQWREFQSDRVSKIREWYQEHYKNVQIGDPLIQYIVLWSVFNALYNTYDLPNNHLPEKINGRYRFKDRLGYKLPAIRASGDFDRVKKFAGKLAGFDTFATLLNGDQMKSHIAIFVDRIPSVAQDEEIDVNRAIPIILQNDSEKWVVESEFTPASIRGVASLDHRLFLTDGYKFFEYAAMDNPWNAQAQLISIETTTKQLLNVLYQLRNNIVHGGSTAYHRKEIILEAKPILEEIIGFVFNNVNYIFVGKK